MRNIEKYNKYYGKSTYDSRKLIYFMICIFLIITFFFGPLGGGVSNLPENNNITPVVNAPENIPPVTPIPNPQSPKNIINSRN